MSIVGAYIDLPKGQEPPGYGEKLELEGSFEGLTPEGLIVEWGWPGPPLNAQVYLYWEPKVVAIWEEEEIESDNGDEVEPAGPSTPEEVDEEPGQPGDFVGEEPAPSPEEPEPVE